jgi:hypothetical protein
MPQRSSEIPSVLVALLLIFFPPLGLILMWTSTDWSSDVKWGISGIFFPPLWLRFLWKVWWLPYAVGALLAAVTLQGAIFGGLSVAGAVAILTIIAIVLLLTLGSQRSGKQEVHDFGSQLRQTIDDKLDLCNNLIADIEADLSLELLPANNPARARYIRALEMRSQGQELFQRAATQPQLVEADTRISRALRELRSVRDGIAGTDPRLDAPR